MPLYRDEAVVLRTAKLGEADRIITLMTRNHGKVRAVAKGIRRVKSRFGGRLEPFMRVDLLIAQGRSLDVISQAESVSSWGASIAADYEAYEAANVITETVEKLVGDEQEPLPGQYRLLLGALNALANATHHPRAIAASYVMRALALAGWEPRLRSCVVCGRMVESAEVFFSVASGGVMCATDHTPDAHRIPVAVLNQCRALIDGDWTVLDAAPLDRVAEELVEDWAEYYLERPLRSLRVSERPTL